MYAKIINDEVIKFPYFIQDLKAENPHTSYAENIEVDYSTLAEFNVYRVFPTAEPTVNAEVEKAVKGSIVKQDGRWVESWDIVALTDEEQQLLKSSKADEIRAERNRLLVESDWTQFRDIAESTSQKWVSYRQQLRDISLQEGFPFSVQFPVKPE